MATILFIVGSPSPSSKSPVLIERASLCAARFGLTVERLDVRELPARELLAGSREAEPIGAAVTALAAAAGAIVSTPVYKAAYTGLLKCFLDLLPEAALAGKVVLPIVTAGAPNHALALDYALKPVLASLLPKIILPGFVGLDKEFVKAADGSVDLGPEAAARFDAAAESIAAACAG